MEWKATYQKSGKTVIKQISAPSLSVACQMARYIAREFDCILSIQTSSRTESPHWVHHITYEPTGILREESWTARLARCAMYARIETSKNDEGIHGTIRDSESRILYYTHTHSLVEAQEELIAALRREIGRLAAEIDDCAADTLVSLQSVLKTLRA